MRSSALSKIRIGFSIFVILLLTATFVDISHLIPERYINISHFLQFIPSANKFISAGVAASTGFIIILVLTIITGRTYCSFLCPLGILQDIFSRTGGRIKKRFRRYGFKKPQTILRYAILAATLIITMTWGIYFLTLLDPYSIFGRSMTFFVKPVVLLLNNLLSHIFGKFDIYTFVQTPVTLFSPAAYYIPIAILLLVGILSLANGRLYCNAVCPVGTFLGIISKVSLLQIKFDGSKCTKCGRCAVACKSSCIDFLNKDIDNSRCVGCFNCLKSCQDKALEYNFISFKKPAKDAGIGKETGIDYGRRNAISVSLLILLGLKSQSSSAQNKTAPVPKKASTVKEKRTSPVSPPGSASIVNFTTNCTACSLCISVCPNNVLVPSVTEYGLTSVMQPHLDFRKGFCAYECVRCLDVCPTGALLPLTIEAKKLTQIGKSVFIKDNCIVNTEKTACGACAESCPTKAVHMVPFEGKLVIPETKDEICIGCGHCEFACPTTPYKAIFVNGNPKHAAALKPVNTQTDIRKPEEFPF
jgi:ferredoxin-type protein NapF